MADVFRKKEPAERRKKKGHISSIFTINPRNKRPIVKGRLCVEYAREKKGEKKALCKLNGCQHS